VLARPSEAVQAPTARIKLQPRLFATQVAEAAQLISEKYVREVAVTDLLRWGIEALYQRAELPLPKAIRARLDRLGQGQADPVELLADVRTQVGARQQLEYPKDVEAALGGMLAHLDPRSAYVDPKALAEERKFNVNQTSQVGLACAPDKDTAEWKVAGTVKDSPAYRAGIRHDDVLREIHLYENAEGAALASPRVIPLKGLPDKELSRLLAGRPGARVDLVIQRDMLDRPLTFALKFENLQLETVLGVRRKEDDSWDYMLDPERHIAYIRVPHFFGMRTAQDLMAVLGKLSETGMKGLILDLRGNPGGRAIQGLQVCEDLVQSGAVVVELQGRGPNVGKITAKRDDGFTEVPIVCLVDHETASTAELVAACLQDHGRATLLGERTFGKGSMQIRYPFHGGELRLTTSLFRRPSGANLDREHLSDPAHTPWGVTPDREQRLSEADHGKLKKYLARKTLIRDAGKDVPYRDEQLAAAVALLGHGDKK
jgi:C-terminal peptidase prc